MKLGYVLFIILFCFSNFSYAQYVTPPAGNAVTSIQVNCRDTSMSDVTVTSASGGDLLISSNTQRRCLKMVNKGATDAYICKDSAPTSSTNCFVLKASGGAWEAIPVPTNTYYGITSSGSTTLTVSEGIFP